MTSESKPPPLVVVSVEAGAAGAIGAGVGAVGVVVDDEAASAFLISYLIVG